MATLTTLQQKAKQGLTVPEGAPTAQAVQAGLGIKPPSVQPALQQLTSVATTGKAAPTGVGAGPAASGVQERLAQEQVSEAQQQLVTTAAREDKALAQKEQEAYLKLSDEAFAIREQAIQTKNGFRQQIETLLLDMEARLDQIDFENEADRMEHVYQLARLDNEKYINKLQLEGARSRLDNNAKFQEEYLRTAFEDNLSLLRDDFGFKMGMLATDREFKLEMAEMDIETAIRLLEGDMAAEKEGTLYSGIQTGISGGLQAWSLGSKALEKKQIADNLETADKFGTAGGGSDNDPNTPW